MAINGLSRFKQVNVASGDAANSTVFGVQRPNHERPVMVQFGNATSAAVSIHGTNFFDFDTGVGTHWLGVYSHEAAAGQIYTFSGDTLFAGYMIRVDSAADLVTYAFGS